jgi:hypothetical protein
MASRIKNRPKVSNWGHGKVDEKNDHFTISFGNPNDEGPSSRPVIAKIGRSGNAIFRVELLTADKTQCAALERDIIFYLNELPKERQITDIDDIWQYQQYHCSTTANLYGDCHWHFNSGLKIISNTKVAAIKNNRLTFLATNLGILLLIVGAFLWPNSQQAASPPHLDIDPIFGLSIVQACIVEFLLAAGFMLYFCYPGLVKKTGARQYLSFMLYSLILAALQILFVGLMLSTDIYSWGLEQHEKAYAPLALIVFFTPTSLLLGSLLFFISKALGLMSNNNDGNNVNIVKE